MKLGINWDTFKNLRLKNVQILDTEDMVQEISPNIQGEHCSLTHDEEPNWSWVVCPPNHLEYTVRKTDVEIRHNHFKKRCHVNEENTWQLVYLWV